MGLYSNQAVPNQPHVKDDCVTAVNELHVGDLVQGLSK